MLMGYKDINKMLPLVNKYMDDFVSPEKGATSQQMAEMLAILCPDIPVSTCKRVWGAYAYIIPFLLYKRAVPIYIPLVGFLRTLFAPARHIEFTPVSKLPNYVSKSIKKYEAILKENEGIH